MPQLQGVDGQMGAFGGTALKLPVLLNCSSPHTYPLSISSCPEYQSFRLKGALGF